MGTPGRVNSMGVPIIDPWKDSKMPEGEKIYIQENVIGDTSKFIPFFIFTNKPLARVNNGIEYEIVTQLGDTLRMLNGESYFNGQNWIMYCSNTNPQAINHVLQGTKCILKAKDREPNELKWIDYKEWYFHTYGELPKEPDAGVQSPWLLDDGNELASNMGSL